MRRFSPFLTSSQKHEFHKDGFLVLNKFFNENDCNLMKSTMESILLDWEKNEYNTEDKASVFSTNEQERTSDEYFLSSGDKIRFFWEENAFDEHGKLANGSPSLSINKVGHGLHNLNHIFKKYSFDCRMGRIARDLGMVEPKAAQSMYIFKQPGIGGPVDAHQDGTFLYTEPLNSVLGFWIALEKCTVNNGCLWAIPGSSSYEINRRFVRNPSNTGTEFINITGKQDDWNLENAQCIECEAGTMILLHHSLVHFSKANTSNTSRHAYAMHVIDGSQNYPSNNWLSQNTPFPNL